ncbi:MAG: hypothetical protein WCG47_24465 [Dermatophilaceae bacterium]
MRITFSAIPAYGHVLPMAPLAAATADGGHDVTFGREQPVRWPAAGPGRPRGARGDDLA